MSVRPAKKSAIVTLERSGMIQRQARDTRLIEAIDDYLQGKNAF